MAKIKTQLSKSLYLQIGWYLLAAFLVGAVTFFVVNFSARQVFLKDTKITQSIQQKLDTAFNSLETTLENKNDKLDETLDNWTYENKYYIVYLIDKNGTLIYSNDGLYLVGDGEVSFPNEKLYQMTINGEQTNVSLTYLFAAEITSRIDLLAIISAVCLGLAVFVWLFKGMVDRIKKISEQLEIISGGDVSVTIIDPKEDEIGLLVANLNQMRTSLMSQYYQVEELERKQYQKIAVLSHDLRTPLTVMNGYLEIMRQAESTPELNVYLDKFAEKLSEIQDLSTELFANVEGKSVPQPRALSLQSMNAEEFTAEMARFVESVKLSHFKINVVLPAQLTELGMAPAEWRQLLTSLHSNLVNYGDQGQAVSLECRLEGNFLLCQLVNRIDHQKEPLLSSKRGLSLQQELLLERGGVLNYFADEHQFYLFIKIPLLAS